MQYRWIRQWARLYLVLAAVLACNVGPAWAGEPGTIAQEMVRRAPEVVKYLKDKGYHNVGVLKFVVSKDQARFSDNVGTLNKTLADRLEVALVLANDPRKPLGIIHNASAVAAQTRGANHLKRESRLKLFEPDYPLAWASPKVKADAFVTGSAVISDDLRTLTVSLFVFDKATNKLVPLGEDFTALVEPDRVSEMGESFLVRGLFDDTSKEPRTTQAKVLQAARRVKTREVAHPLETENPPVGLEVRYDGEVVPMEFRDGKALVPEPLEGQKVSLVLKRDNRQERYAVVLKVNGENTLEHQRLPDLECRKWVLDSGDGPVAIDGYYRADNETAEAFRVLSQEESQQNEMNYGDNVGTITLTVFREQRGEEPPPDMSDEAARVEAVSLAQLPPKIAANAQALKAQLLDEANRGLIAQGQAIAGKVQRFKFKPDSTPVMSATLVYYQRRR